MRVRGERVMQSSIGAERLRLKAHPELSEKWAQQRIAEKPTILVLGDLDLIGQEVIHTARAYMQ